MSAAIVIRNRDGGEVQITLHPITLALLLAEAIEDTARGRCRRKGHGPADADGRHCERCGISLPDSGGFISSWFPPAYRTIRGKA